MPSIKEIYNSIGEVELNADSINLNVDGLEALASTQQADIALIKADVDDIRVDLANGVTLTSAGTTGSAAPANANLVGGTDGTNLRAFSTDTAGRVNLNNELYTDANLSYSFTGAISASTVLIPSTDVSGFREASIHLTALGTGGSNGIIAQISNDNTNWINCGVSSPNQSYITTAVTSTTIHKANLFGARYFRVISATMTGGTTSLVVYLSRVSTTPPSQSVTVANTVAVSSSVQAVTGQGHSTYHTAISAASTNATNVKNVAGNIGSLIISNTSSSIKYIKLFNLTVAPTMGTSSPVLNYAIMPNSTMAIDCGFAGIRFSTGISYAITGGQALLDTTAVGAGDVVVNIAYV